MDRKIMLGNKLRRFRQDQGLRQSEMAERIGISPSYLNLIEHNQRPVTVPLLFKLGQAFDFDLREFAGDDDTRLAAGLKEVFSDPLFAGQPVPQQEIRELVASSPTASQAMVTLYDAYRRFWEEAQARDERAAGEEGQGPRDGQPPPVEEIRDYQQAQANHFPEIETAAERLAEEADFAGRDLFAALTGYLEAIHATRVKIMPVDVLQDTLRRYDHHGRRILLSEALPPSGRAFQLAVQVALISQRELLDREAAKANLQNPQSLPMLRIVLANHFAAALMMPYDRFLEAATQLRYDIDLLRRRFGASFEQVCHRLTTMQRPGARGVPFFFIRVDNAGNISKRLSGGGFHFARLGGTCPRWIVHDAFRTPGLVQTQVAVMPDGTTFFTIGRTLDLVSSRLDALQPQFSVGLGCEINDAKNLVYADGIDLKNPRAIPIGVSCRVCERLDCAQRAYPPLNHQLRIDEHVRRSVPFTFTTR